MKRIITIYFLIFILFSVCYLALFHTPLFRFQKVLFYRGIGLLFFTIILFFIFEIIYYLKFSRKNIESILAAIIVSSAIHLAIFVLLPVTFERSVTMYLLNTLSQNKLTKSQLEDKLIKEYIIKNKAIDKRVIEQKFIHVVDDSQKKLQLTKQGINFLRFSEVIKKIYGI